MVDFFFNNQNSVYVNIHLKVYNVLNVKSSKKRKNLAREVKRSNLARTELSITDVVFFSATPRAVMLKNDTPVNIAPPPLLTRLYS